MGPLEPSKVFIDTSNAKWYQDIMEHTLALSEDKPSIKDMLSGDEKEDWTSAIKAELAQIKKLGRWEITPTPINANIIGCRL
ncbi:hypothetical protein H0H87_002204, partial [Tephrocybe sp. NHM501043]